jgi:hypothetical protein
MNTPDVCNGLKGNAQAQCRRRFDFTIKEAKDDKAWASKTKKNRKWMKEASSESLRHLDHVLNASVDDLAKEHFFYWKLRATTMGAWGNMPVDAHAMQEWIDIGRGGAGKRCILGLKDTPTKCYKGWVIGRKLIDHDGKLKPFSYYPPTVHGKPHYLYKTKAEAMKAFKWQKAHDKFPGDQDNAVVVKFSKKVYLDRY